MSSSASNDIGQDRKGERSPSSDFSGLTPIDSAISFNPSSPSDDIGQECKGERSPSSDFSGLTPVDSAISFNRSSPSDDIGQECKGERSPSSVFSGRTLVDLSPSQAWTDSRGPCELAKARDMERLVRDYNIRGLSFQLSHIIPRQKIEEYILSRFSNRFFLWLPNESELRFIRTPWSLKGLQTALNSGEPLETQVMRKWDYSQPGVEDEMPCLPPPKDWDKDPINLFAAMDLRQWDLYHRKPILYYNSYSGDEDADFFYSEGHFYLYLPFHDWLYEMPDMNLYDPAQFAKLGTAGHYFKNLKLKKLGPAEFLGGRRVLNQAAIPPGWIQEVWDEKQPGPALPARCKNLPSSHVLTSEYGKTQIIEVGDEYFKWSVIENRLFPIVAPNGLEGILRRLRSDSRLELVED